MPRKPKPFSYNDLSKLELSLLEYPPTEKTWVCPGIYQDKNAESINCQMVNSGEKCWVCGTKKSSKATLLWPTYLDACKKVEIEPGTRWKKVSAKTGLIYDPEKGRWSEKDMVTT